MRKFNLSAAIWSIVAAGFLCLGSVAQAGDSFGSWGSSGGSSGGYVSYGSSGGHYGLFRGT
jgi:hypothetical protein